MQLLVSNCFHGKRPLWELKLLKRDKTPLFIVDKILKEAKIKFLIEHDKKESKKCIITLHIKETPDKNISDISNELKQILVHNYFYILGRAKTYINFTPIYSPTKPKN